ncbi:uncharacterized protein ACIBXB_012062 isoform 1-T1 [Morphnus guianensis]
MEGRQQMAPVKSQLHYSQRGGDYRHGCQKEPIGEWERQRLLQLLGGYFCRTGSNKQQIRLGRVGKWHLFCWKWCCCGRDAGFCMVHGQAQPGQLGICHSAAGHLSSSSSCRAWCVLPLPAAGYQGAPSSATGCSPRQSRARHLGLGSRFNGGRTPAPQAAATGMSILLAAGAATRSCTFGSHGSPSSPCSCTGIREIRNLLPLGLAGEAMGPGQSRGRPSPFLVPRSASAFPCQAFCHWTTGVLTLGLCTIPKRDRRPCSGKAPLQGKAQLPSPPCSRGTPAQPPAPRHRAQPGAHRLPAWHHRARLLPHPSTEVRSRRL